MATFISDNQKFHIFSKSPVRANMELFQATNKSGHIVISDEVRTDDIPWFINVPDVNNPPSYVKDPRKNDIIFQGKFNSLSTAAVCKKWDGEKWVDGPNLKENPILKNKNDDDVIQVHFENDIEYVSDTNNAGTTSDKQAAFVLKTNGEMLTHFVSPTDKIYNGIPSNGYGLYLFLDSQLQSETDSNDNGYIANSYAGIIQFNKARSEGASKFKVITFEYIGGYLDKSLNKIEEDLKDYIDEEIKEHNNEFIAHKNNQNSEKHLSQSEVNSLNALTSTSKISSIETATQYDYQAETDLDKALNAETISDTSDNTFKNVTITLHLRDKVLQQSTMPVTSKAIYNHVHKESVDIEKASNNVTVEEVTTKDDERRKYTIAVDGYTTSETDNIVDDIYEKIQATADDINKNVVEHTSNNGIHITDTERVSWNNNEVVLQKHLNDLNSHVSEADRILWNSGGNMSISGDDFINATRDDNNLSVSLNVTSNISDNSSNKVPTAAAVNSVVTDINDTIEALTENFNLHKTDEELHFTKTDIVSEYAVNDKDSDRNKYITSLSYGFVIKPETNMYLTNLQLIFVRPGVDSLYLYNPGNFSGSGDINSDLPSFPAVYFKVTDIATGEILGTSQPKLINDATWAYRKGDIDKKYGLSIGFAFNSNEVGLVRGKEYAITAHSTPESTTPDFLLPLGIWTTTDLSTNNKFMPNRLIINANINGYYTNEKVFEIDNSATGGAGTTSYFISYVVTKLSGNKFEHFNTSLTEEAIFVHTDNDDIHLSKDTLLNTVWANESKVIDNIEWDGITQGTEQATCGGFRFTLDKEVTCNAIEVFDIGQIGGDASKAAHIKIWKQNADSSATLVAASKDTTELGEPNPETWIFKNEVTLLPNIRYVVTFNDNNSSPQFSAGYTIRFTKMAKYANTDIGFHILAQQSVSDFNGSGNYYCPKFVLKTSKAFTSIPVLENRVNQYIANASAATILADEVITPVNESITLNNENKVITFNISNNENIAIVSYTPHIAADINAISTITNNEISFDVSKKDSTINGEYFFVLEILYIDKILKQVKRAYGYTELIIE